MKTYAGMPGIRTRRRVLGIKVADAAAALGVTKTTWYDWEKGKYVPSAALLPAMAALLGCGIEELYRGDGETGVRDDGECDGEGASWRSC